MPHYAIVEDATGRAVSFGTVIADPMPDGLVAVQLGRAPDFAADRWDAATRTLRAAVVPAPGVPPAAGTPPVAGSLAVGAP